MNINTNSMFPFSHWAFEMKLFLASLFGGSALLADLAGEAKGYEDLGLKAILIVALVYIGKLYLDQQKEHKLEMKDMWDAHKQEFKESIEANTKGMAELTSLTREQTDYFKTVTRNIVDDRIKTKPNIP